MTHLWVRAEQRLNEERVGITPEGVAALVKAGIRVTVERSSVRAIGLEGYETAGCEIAAENAWPGAPRDAIIFGLKELPEDGTPLTHQHIMFMAHSLSHQSQNSGRMFGGRISFLQHFPFHGHVPQHFPDGLGTACPVIVQNNDRRFRNGTADALYSFHQQRSVVCLAGNEKDDSRLLHRIRLRRI